VPRGAKAPKKARTMQVFLVYPHSLVWVSHQNSERSKRKGKEASGEEGGDGVVETHGRVKRGDWKRANWRRKLNLRQIFDEQRALSERRRRGSRVEWEEKTWNHRQIMKIL